jgi:hypothetical protein
LRLLTNILTRKGSQSRSHGPRARSRMQQASRCIATYAGRKGAKSVRSAPLQACGAEFCNRLSRKERDPNVAAGSGSLLSASIAGGRPAHEGNCVRAAQLVKYRRGRRVT